MTIECDVSGCEKPAIAKALPTHGETDHHAYRCKECLVYDVERGWFAEWRGKVEARDE